MKALTRLALLAVATVLTACGTDTYDTGDGALSGMMADFVEAQTDAYANMVSIETDDGERLELTTPVAMEWASRPDTVYRALFYYSLADGNDGQAEADPMAVQQVLVPEITPADDIADGVKTDPVALETAWLSSNGRYINLGVIIKTGTADGSQGTQTVGIVYDGTETTADGKRYVRAEGDSVVYETDDPGWTLYTRRSHWVKLALFDDPSVSAEIQSVIVKGTSPTDGETFDYTLMKTAGESDGTLIWKAEGHEEALDTVKIDSFLRQITELRGADLIVPPVGLTSETAAVTIVLGFRDGSKQTLCISSNPAGEDRYGVTLAGSDREYAVSRYALGNLLKPLENFFRAEEK